MQRAAASVEAILREEHEATRKKKDANVQSEVSEASVRDVLLRSHEASEAPGVPIQREEYERTSE